MILRQALTRRASDIDESTYSIAPPSSPERPEDPLYTLACTPDNESEEVFRDMEENCSDGEHV